MNIDKEWIDDGKFEEIQNREIERWRELDKKKISEQGSEKERKQAKDQFVAP